jgi:hypothetical protein
MKVFICWSQERSKTIAEELRRWLKIVIQQIDPWMSDEDIRAGARWHPEITNILAECKVGIICLTPENLKSEWIHFEAGALSKTVEKTYVCPLLIGGLEKEDVPYPLAQFQLKKANKDGMFDIVKTINSVLNKTFLLSDEILKKTFDKWWPDLEKVIKELPVLATNKTKRTQDEMLEEILNSVRALSNMISEQGWSMSREDLSSSLADIFRAYRPYTPIEVRGAGIGRGSTGPTGPVERELSEVVRRAVDLMSPSEKPADDKKKTE